MSADNMTDVSEEEKGAEKEEKELEQKWKNLHAGNLDHDLLPDDEEDQFPPGSMKGKVAHILTHWKFELFIVVLIIGDLVFTLIEVGIDYKMVCVGGELVPVGRQSIKGLSMQQYPMTPTFKSMPSTLHDLGHNTSLSSPAFSADTVSLQNEAVRGAVMLQVSNAVEGLARVAHFTNKQSEEVPAAQPEGSENAETEEEGHGEHEDSHTLVCEGPHGENRHHLSHTCHLGSVAILTVFLMELMAKAWVNFSKFVSSFFQLLDLAVVSISFIVDFVWPFVIGHLVKSASDHLLGESQSDAIKFLLLTVRLLRIVRVIHGGYGVLSKGLAYTKELKEKVKEKEEEIIKLKGELAAAKK